MPKANISLPYDNLRSRRSFNSYVASLDWVCAENPNTPNAHYWRERWDNKIMFRCIFCGEERQFALTIGSAQNHTPFNYEK
ncbi:hypothetical protein LCGC14_0316130 [marine sediment metagenome]|uniref:Uncharacterized protein n=1 Tax=marine sediment metagenome TaxID=412755 RepID=A0A0F9W7N8_9ZZZZ